MQEKWTPEAEEVFRQGQLSMVHDTEMSKSWTVVGLMAAGLSGFIVGITIGVIIGRFI